METINSWGNMIIGAFSELFQGAAQYLPSLMGAFLLLLIGWLVARVLRVLSMRAAVLLERLVYRTGSPVAEATRLPRSSARVLGSIVFWIVLLFFITAATQVLGLDAFARGLAGVVEYLPTMVAGALIIAAGFLLSRLARELVSATAPGVNPRQREALGRIVQGLILVTSILVGAEQIGIRVTFLVIIAATAGGTVVAAVALALSLGARNYVANLIGGRYMRQNFAVGQRLKVLGYQGRILELTPVSVVLETEEGRVTLPAKLFGEEPIVLQIGDDSRG